MITLSADFGGQRIKLGLVQDGRVIRREAIPAQAHEPLRARLGAVGQAFHRLCGEARIRLEDCAGVSLAYPSIVDSEQARIRDHFGKFGDARELDMRAWAREALGLPLVMDNDARLALVGEWRYGAGRDCANLVMITLGTGLGVSAVIEGRVLRGVHGQAGILGGHVTLRYGGRPCVCGNLGCAEAEASTAVLERLAHLRADFAASGLASEPALDYASVFRCAAQGDACARALQAHSLQVWSALAVSLIHAYDPERLILGGGIMGSAEVILPAVREHVARHAHTPWGRVEVLGSELGDQAALLAGEWLVQEHLATQSASLEVL